MMLSLLLYLIQRDAAHDSAHGAPRLEAESRQDGAWGIAHSPGAILSALCFLRSSDVFRFGFRSVAHKLLGGLLQTVLAARTKAIELANALLAGGLPEFFRRVDLQLLVQPDSRLQANEMHGQQGTHTARQSLHAQIVIEGHGAG